MIQVHKMITVKTDQWRLEQVENSNLFRVWYEDSHILSVYSNELDELHAAIEVALREYHGND